MQMTKHFRRIREWRCLLHKWGRNSRLISLLLVCFAIIPVSCRTMQEAQLSMDDQGAILSAAENAFIFMKEKRYGDVWESISASSKDAIVGDVLDACKAFHTTCDGEKLRNDFAIGGPDATAYWHHYLEAFAPDSILTESVWKMGRAGAEETEIVVRHKDSDREAVLRVVKEDGVWKLGLEESFGVRKRIFW